MKIEWFMFEREILYKSRTSYVPNFEAEDIAQELRFHLWQNLYTYNPKKASPKTYVNRLITRKVIDLIRTAHMQKRELNNVAVHFSKTRDPEIGMEEDLNEF